MSRFVDRGAVVASWVGVGMAVTIVVSFVLVIPIEPVVWYLALPAGLLIGYYANARSARAGGPWGRVLANAILAGIATALATGLLLLGIKALFFVADSGYRDASSGGPLVCETGPDCVYLRYLAAGHGEALAEAGVTDVDSFTALYWREQTSTVLIVMALTIVGAVGGGAIYGVTNRRRAEDGRMAGEA